MLLIRSVRGFTLVELALAMAFVGVLSISIVLIINNTVAAYQRGITLTRVNSVGIDLSNDIRSSISSSSTRGITNICDAEMFKGIDGSTFNSLGAADSEACKNDNAYKYTFVVHKMGDIPVYGAFCTGEYSYLWNSGYFIPGSGKKLEGENWIVLSYLDEDGNLAPPYNDSGYFRLIKVRDSSKAICVAMRNANSSGGSKYGDETTNEVNISNIGNGRLEGGEPVVLLSNDSGNNLALYDLFVAQPAISTSEDNMFYSVSFVLGTTSGGADILAKGNSCAAPNDLVNGSSNYCAINKFNIAIQVNGGK